MARRNFFEKRFPIIQTSPCPDEIADSNQNENGRMEAFSGQRQTKVKGAGFGSEGWSS